MRSPIVPKCYRLPQMLHECMCNYQYAHISVQTVARGLWLKGLRTFEGTAQYLRCAMG